jgi:hypothetical protein
VGVHLLVGGMHADDRHVPPLPRIRRATPAEPAFGVMRTLGS